MKAATLGGCRDVAKLLMGGRRPLHIEPTSVYVVGRARWHKLVLSFNMVDLNVPSFPHGGGTISYKDGDQVGAGSFSYQGPCPPVCQIHNSRWTVKAIDAAGKPLATTSAARPFPPR